MVRGTSFTAYARGYVAQFLRGFRCVEANEHSDGSCELRFVRQIGPRVVEQLFVKRDPQGDIALRAQPCVIVELPMTEMVECDALLEVQLPETGMATLLALASAIERAFEDVRPAYPTIVALCDVFGVDAVASGPKIAAA